MENLPMIDVTGGGAAGMRGNNGAIVECSLRRR
jgi:hypothetical protein